MTDQKNSRPYHSRRRAERFAKSLGTRESSHDRAQREAIESFRTTARYSFAHKGVIEAFSELSDAKARQKLLGIELPVWDAFEQREI